MFKKVISFVTSSAIAAAFITFVPVNEGKRSNNAYAKTIAEMQEEIKSNKETISELQNQLDALAGNKAEEIKEVLPRIRVSIPSLTAMIPREPSSRCLRS